MGLEVFGFLCFHARPPPPRAGDTHADSRGSTVMRVEATARPPDIYGLGDGSVPSETAEDLKPLQKRSGTETGTVGHLVSQAPAGAVPLGALPGSCVRNALH